MTDFKMTDFKTRLGSKPKIFLRLASTSKSGMSRTFDCFIIHENDIVNVNHEVSAYTSERRNSEGSIVIKGCGMDMAFALVYKLSVALFDGDGYKLKYATL